METTVASFVGNLNLVSNEEDILAEYLKKHNLEQTNTMSAKVELNWNPSFQFASLSSDLANRLHK